MLFSTDKYSTQKTKKSLMHKISKNGNFNSKTHVLDKM